MKRIYSLLLALIVIQFTISGCEEDETCNDGVQNQTETGIDCGGECPDCSTCTDGIHNQNEEGVDCGGDCPDSCPTCNDGIENQDEEEVDCGGPCPPCPNPSLTAVVDGTSWSATLIECYLQNGNLVITGTNLDEGISIIHDEAFEPGTYTLEYFDGNYTIGTTYNCVMDAGTITFTEFDTFNERVSGTFSFDCTATSGSSSITSGSFTDLSYD